jgi:prepilin-type N-terminal cleavage/methylation domain-containing protein
MSARADRSGFTLLEVMIATIILSIGLVVLLTSFANCQRVMKASQDYETAQYVLSLGETVYPIPTPELVTGDPLDDEKLNIDETSAEDLLEDLEIDSSSLSRERREELSSYTFSRTVDEIDDEELKRAGYLYTLRTKIVWGSRRLRDEDRPKLEVLTLWRKTQ